MTSLLDHSHHRDSLHCAVDSAGEGLIRCSVPCSLKVLAGLKVGLARVGYDASAMRSWRMAGLFLFAPASGTRSAGTDARP